MPDQGRAGRYLRLAAWWWLALFGIWPLAHPEHFTFSDPVTWIDWTLHLAGLSVVGPPYARWWWRLADRTVARVR